MEFKEFCEGRWTFFFGSLFWSIAIPAVYGIAFKQLTMQSVSTIVIVTLLMGIMAFAAVMVFISSIKDIIANGKTHLILNDDSLQIVVNKGKLKGRTHEIDYAEIEEFYFVSDGTRKDKKTGKYYIKEKSSGLLGFYKGSPENNDFYKVTIYDAMPAAQFILGKLQDEQIDSSKNELDKDGTHHPKG